MPATPKSRSRSAVQTQAAEPGRMTMADAKVTRRIRKDLERLCRDLVERDRVFEAAARRMRGTGEEADVGRMAAVDERMGEAGEHGESVAKRREFLEIG